MAARFWVGGTGTWDGSDTTHWAATSGGAGGQTVPGVADTVTIDGSSGAGTITVNTNFSVTSLTCGAMGMTLDFAINNNSPTMQTLNGSGTGTRTINMGSGTWTVTGSAATIVNFGTQTNLTLNSNSSTFVFNYSGSTGTRAVSASGINFNNISVTAGSDTFNINGTFVGNANFTGFTGSLGTSSLTVNGNLTFGTGMSVSATATAITIGGTSGTKVITSNGVTIDRPITINGAGGTFQLADALTMGSTRTLTITAGTFDANDKAVSVGLVASSNSNTRSILMGTNTWSLTGTGTVWNTGTTTNLTFTPSTSTIAVTDISASSKTFTGGGLTYNNFSVTGTGSGAVIMQGSNIWNNFTVNPPKTVTFTAGTTQTINGVPSFTGTVGNVITINSSSAGTPATLSKPGSTVSGDYLSIQDSIATGGAVWYAGANSTNVSGNTGWIFAAQPTTVVNVSSKSSGTSAIGRIASIGRL